MMEPVEFRGYCSDCENETIARDGRCGCGSGRVIRLSDAEARIAELETRLKYAYEAKHRCNEDANHERQRAITAEARAEAAEALLKEAKAALEPFAQEAARYEPDEGDGDDSAWAIPAYFKTRDLRAARSIAAKIGGKDE